MDAKKKNHEMSRELQRAARALAKKQDIKYTAALRLVILERESHKKHAL